MNKVIAVVQGSVNCDLVAAGESLPLMGQTVLGTDFHMYSGGKGANQAVQLARMGAEVYLIARVGTDSYGDFVLDALRSAGVRLDFVKREDPQTGLGMVQRGADGQYYAMVIPGANAACCAQDVERAREVIARAGVVIGQMETTDEALLAAAQAAHDAGVPFILNPAPAKAVDSRLFALSHTVTPNETETAFYTGLDAASLTTPERWQQAAAGLRKLGAQRAVITLGDKGCFFDDGAVQRHVEALPIRAVDTTAAGDAFNGAYAYGIACKQEPADCLALANAAGAAAASKAGAQPSMADLAELERMLQNKG